MSASWPKVPAGWVWYVVACACLTLNGCSLAGIVIGSILNAICSLTTNKKPKALTSGLNSVGVFIPPRSFAFDVRAYTNYAASKLVFKSFLQISSFSMLSSAISVKKTAELNKSTHHLMRSIHCFSVRNGA